MNSPFFLNIASTRLVVSLPLARRVAKSYPPLLIRLLHWNAGRDKRSVNTHSRNGKRHPTIAQPSLSQWFHAAPQGQGHAEKATWTRPRGRRQGQGHADKATRRETMTRPRRQGHAERDEDKATRKKPSVKGLQRVIK